MLGTGDIAVANIVAADIQVAVHTVAADTLVVADMKPARDRAYLDTVTALYFVHYIGYIACIWPVE
jgi:hypothetical protein